MGEAARTLELEIDPLEELWREETVLARTGLTESTMNRLIKAGEFPRGRRYEGFTGTFYLASEIRTWIAWQKARSVKAIPQWRPPAG